MRSQAAPPPPADLLLPALARLLRPLVRLLIRAGVTFPALADLLRSLYVEVALQDVLTPEQARTDSRVTLLTGVHRKEIRRRRLPRPEPAPRGLTLSSKTIARWLGTPALTGPDGRPAPLNRSGPAPSFEALVAEVTTDVRPRALLDAWLDSGVARLDGEGRVVLEQAAFVPRGDPQQILFLFARQLHDHIAAAAANLAAANLTVPGPPPFLDRSLHYDGLSAAAASRLEAAARAAAEATLLDLNRTALAIADADERAAGGAPRRHRVALGLYLYAEEAKGAES